MQISNIIKRGFGPALFIALFGTVQAFAQTTYTEKDAAWWQSLETQLTESASSEITQVRVEAFQQIIFFAENYSDRADFSEASYEAMARFESSASVEERLLALATINAIGDEVSLNRLAKVASNDASARVRSVAASVLKNHAS